MALHFHENKELSVKAHGAITISDSIYMCWLKVIQLTWLEYVVHYQNPLLMRAEPHLNCVNQFSK